MMYSFYKEDTGEFLPRTVRCPADSIKLNTPHGTVAVEGYFQPSTHKFDFEAGEVIALAQTNMLD